MYKRFFSVWLFFIAGGFWLTSAAQTNVDGYISNSFYFTNQSEAERVTGFSNLKFRNENHSGWWTQRYLLDYALIAGGTTGYIIGKGITPSWDARVGPSFDPNNPAAIFGDDTFSEPYLEHGEGETVPEYWIHRLLIGFGGALITMEGLEWRGNGGSAHHFHNTIIGYAETVALTAAVTELSKPFFGRLRPDFRERALRFHCPDSPPSAIEPFCDGYRELPLDEDPDEAQKLYNDGRKSFISGHSSHSFNLFGYASLVIGGRYVWGEGATSRSRRAGVAGQAVMMGSAFYITSSRIRDGRHHLSDVIVGSLIGTGIANLSYWTRFDREGTPRWRSSEKRRDAEGTASDFSVNPWVTPYGSAGVQAKITF